MNDPVGALLLFFFIFWPFILIAAFMIPKLIRAQKAHKKLARTLGARPILGGGGHQAEYEGGTYRYGVEAGSIRGEAPCFWILLFCDPKFDFLVQKEGGKQRFLKGMGICREIQTGDADFDQRFYIESKSESSVRDFFSDPANRKDISRLFDLGYHCLRLDSKNKNIAAYKLPVPDFEILAPESILEVVRILKALVSLAPY